MIHFLLIFILTNISNGTTPYNTILPGGNPLNFPAIITENYPWFWGAVLMFLFIVTDYLLSAKANLDSKIMLLACALVYTIVSYIMVLGSLLDPAYFFLFEVISILLFFVIMLFSGNG